MSARNVFIPTEILVDLCKIIRSEQYTALLSALPDVHEEASAEHLSLTIEDARNLLRVVDIEMSKAILRYPHNEDDDPQYDPEHEECYDEIMMGIYEKTYYYVQSEFPELKS
jgi:hypothetical protein